jgi:hypothetical protein
MRRTPKELALAIGGVGLGTTLFIIASSHVYFQEMSYMSWGYPLPWHFAGDLIPPSSFPIPGLNLGAVAWGAFYEDLLFWLALPVATIEISAHSVPYIMRVLKLRREKRKTTVTSAFGFVETPN